MTNTFESSERRSDMKKQLLIAALAFAAVGFLFPQDADACGRCHRGHGYGGGYYSTPVYVAPPVVMPPVVIPPQPVMPSCDPYYGCGGYGGGYYRRGYSYGGGYGYGGSYYQGGRGRGFGLLFGRW
jgi:hypothetical protein